MVEAGHVSHDGLLIWPQSAHNICAERERERERQERVKDAGRAAARPEAHAGGIALALDWKPAPAQAWVGAACQGVSGREKGPNEMPSFSIRARV